MNKRPELDTTNPPGQIVNPIPKQECEKLTFDEWYLSLKAKPGQMPYDDWFVCMKEAWLAAQENK